MLPVLRQLVWNGRRLLVTRRLARSARHAGEEDGRRHGRQFRHRVRDGRRPGVDGRPCRRDGPQRRQGAGRGGGALNDAAGGGEPIQLVVFDLADLASVRRGAAEILEQAPHLDVLVNNAGLVLTERAETVDGFEATFAIEPSRAVPPHQPVARAPDGIGAGADRERGVDGAYRRPQGDALRRPPDHARATGPCASTGSRSWPTSSSPLELSRRLAGTGVTANSLHPGTVRTGYGADGDARGLLAFGIKIASPFFLSPAKGARTSVYLASSPEVEGVSGEYFVKCKPSAAHAAGPRTPRPRARLWQVSEELVGLLRPRGA